MLQLGGKCVHSSGSGIHHRVRAVLPFFAVNKKIHKILKTVQLSTIFVLRDSVEPPTNTDTRVDPGKDKGHVTRSWISLLEGIMLI